MKKWTRVTILSPMMLILAIGVSNAFNSGDFGSGVRKEEYISHLDLLVCENNEGKVEIVKIGRLSPFRKYSWFRVGDLIEEVEGQAASVILLHSTYGNLQAWIKFRRGGLSRKIQMPLTLSIYGLPGWLPHR